MAENLNYETDSGSWIYNDEQTNAITYGRLYNWETACIACPEGWHLPDRDEVEVLIDLYGGWAMAGGALKEAGTEHWKSPNTGATNGSSFTALPGGIRWPDRSYESLGETGWFWLSGDSGSCGESLSFNLSYEYTNVGVPFCSALEAGQSVRCIKSDSIVSIPDTAFLNILIQERVDTNGDSLISYSEAELVLSLNL